jgi:hypothetical protein
VTAAMAWIDSMAGVAESHKPQATSSRAGTSVVRGVLFLPDDRGPRTGDRAALLDVAGRKALELKPGANDVSRLSPGVYFIKKPRTEDGRLRIETHKVVLTR